MKKNFLKRIGAGTLAAACVICTASLPAFAADTDGLEQAIVIAKSKLTIPDVCTEFDSDVYSSDSGAEYNLRWTSEDGDERVNAVINSRGDIISFNTREDSEEERARFAKYTNEQLLDIAMRWLDSVNPSWSAELPADKANYSLRSDIYNGSEYINIERYKDGVKFLDDSVSFRLDNRTGKIYGMNSTWSYEDNIPAVSEAMSASDAAAEFYKVSPLRLQYEKNSDGTASLVYRPAKPYTRINARKGGEILNRSDAYDAPEAVNDAMSDMVSGGASKSEARFTESEKINLEEIANLIPEEELVKKARALVGTGLDKAEYKNCSYERRTNYYYEKEVNSNEDKEEREYNAVLTFIFNLNKDTEYSARVTFDAKTGELINYWAHDYSVYMSSYPKKDSKNKPAVSAAAAAEGAEKFIRQNAADEAAKVKAEALEDAEEITDYYINFVRYENDVPFYENSINVSVNSESGLVSSFSKNWDKDIKFESADGAIDNAAAEKAFEQNVGFDLSYVYSWRNVGEKTAVREVELCYTARNYSINAKTGEANAAEYEEAPVVHPTDIAGHYAEDKINALVDAGLISADENSEFRPDENITKGDLAEMVGSLMYGYRPWDAEVGRMAQRIGIVGKAEDFDKDAAATRGDGAVYIVRALGYREIAELSDIYNCGFADAEKIPAESVGYVAIARGLKIVGGDENGCFNAASGLSRADAAIMMYNYLAR